MGALERKNGCDHPGRERDLDLDLDLDVFRAHNGTGPEGPAQDWASCRVTELFCQSAINFNGVKNGFRVIMKALGL